MFKQSNPFAGKLRRRTELMRLLTLLVKREVAEGLFLLAREAKLAPEALVSQWVDERLVKRAAKMAVR